MVVKTPRGKSRVDLLSSLQKKGISKVYGRDLAHCLKEELEEWDRNTETWEKSSRHFSNSSVQQYLKCGVQYYFCQIQGIKIPPNASLTLGSSYDETCNRNYSVKIEKGSDEPESTLTDVFHKDFKMRREETDFQGEDPVEVENVGVRMVKVFRSKIAPMVVPVEVQHSGKLEFEDRDWIFVYRMDLIADEGNGKHAVWDNKSSRKGIGQKDADEDPALTAYSMGYSVDFGKAPALLGYHGVVALKTKTDVKWLETERTAEQQRRYLREVAAAVEGIKRRVFKPAPAKAWWCSPGWCGLWNYCHENF